jgi:hypothetical protein
MYLLPKYVRIIELCQVADTLFNLIVLRDLKLSCVEIDICNNRVLHGRIRQFFCNILILLYSKIFSLVSFYQLLISGTEISTI